MRDRTTLALCCFFLFLALRSSLLPAQADDAKPASKLPEISIHTCDSWENPEVLADNPPLRMLLRKNCLEDDKHIQEFMDKHLVKKADVYKGQLAIIAKPIVRKGEALLLNRLEIYLLTSSPWKYQYSLTASCGKWNKTTAGSIESSASSHTSSVLGKPSFSIDVVPPCDLYQTKLEVSQVRDPTGKEYPVQSEITSASVVPGVSDDEMAQRLHSLRGSGKTPGTAATSTSELRRRVDEACKRQQPLGELATGPVSSVGNHMTACAKAYDELADALRVQDEAQAGAQKTVPSNKESTQAPLLSALACKGYYQPASGYNHVEGEIQNVSPVALYAVYAVVTWYTDSGEFVKSENARIQFDPILPKQVSPFEVLMPGNPAMTRFRLAFRTFDGATLPTESNCNAQ